MRRWTIHKESWNRLLSTNRPRLSRYGCVLLPHKHPSSLLTQLAPPPFLLIYLAQFLRERQGGRSVGVDAKTELEPGVQVGCGGALGLGWEVMGRTLECVTKGWASLLMTPAGETSCRLCNHSVMYPLYPLGLTQQGNKEEKKSTVGTINSGIGCEERKKQPGKRSVFVHCSASGLFGTLHWPHCLAMMLAWARSSNFLLLSKWQRILY